MISQGLLNSAKAGRLKATSRHDGGGLYLKTNAKGKASWAFSYIRDGERHYLGLGSFPTIGAKEARRKAGDYRAMLADGKLPHIERAKAKSAARVEAARGVTVAQAVTDFLAVREPSKNEAHGRQWDQTLADYIVAPLGTIGVSDLTTNDVKDALAPLWRTKPDTARRTLGRFARVLDRQIALGTVTANVASLRPMVAILGKVKKETRHHPSMPFVSVPALVKKLRKEKAISARALEFLILTAARTNEVIGLQPEEIDLKKKIWTVPAIRSKTNRIVRIPLSPPALAILREMIAMGETGAPVFRGASAEGGLSGMAMMMLLRRLKVEGVTVHGFRGAFRSWAAEVAKARHDVAELSLGHVIGNTVVQAYFHSDLLDERALLMNAWAKYLG